MKNRNSLPALLVFSMLVSTACKPATTNDQNQGASDSNSILGFGGSTNPWKQDIGVYVYSRDAASPEAQKEIEEFRVACENFASSEAVFKGFQENGCGIGCSPKDYRFSSETKVGGLNRENFSAECWITPTKMTDSEKCELGKVNCCTTPRGKFPPGKLPWGPYTCLPRGECDSEDGICH